MVAKALRVEVQHDYMVVRVTGTSYTASYFKPQDSPQLLARYLPAKSDHRAPMSQPEFLAFAWQMANDKARELG
jgi:hypothetical protein